MIDLLLVLLLLVAVALMAIGAVTVGVLAYGWWCIHANLRDAPLADPHETVDLTGLTVYDDPDWRRFDA